MGLRLSWLVLVAVADNPRAIATQGRLPWRKRDWQILGASAELDPDRLRPLVDRWHDDSDGPAFLSMPEPGMLSLGPSRNLPIR